MKNNFLEYCNDQLKSNRKNVVNELNFIQGNMAGRMCYKPSLEPGFSSPFIIYLLNNYFRNIGEKFSSYLEIGSLYGGSLCCLAHSGFKGTAYGCDIFSGYYGRFENVFPVCFPKNAERSHEGHMKVVSDNVTSFNSELDLVLIRGSSLDSQFQQEIESKDIKDLDVLYIDGLHTEEGCNADWNLYHKFVKKGGMVLVDNFEMTGVKQSLEKVIRPSNLLQELGVWHNSTWIGVKK
jgi:hypothetical protein